MNNREFLRTGIRPMPPRDTHQHHRPSTPLELLFDLVTVIAVAAAAAGLHHDLADGHILDGVLKYLATFFALWLAWLNFTWFASAYDNDDAAFRLLTMVIMAGALTMAAGVKPFFAATDMTLIVAGFVIMRLGMVVLWLRAAKHHRERRSTALTYALGIALAQCYWVGLVMFTPTDKVLFFALYGLGAVLELTVPIVAERLGTTPWHRHHIMERYGLLNIIVLGETLLAGSMALSAVGHGKLDWQLIQVAVLALIIVFALWWLYFSREEHIRDTSRATTFLWGYGHLLIYLAGAAVGAGFAVMVDIATHHSTLSKIQGDYAVAIPVSLYLLGLWLVRDRMLLDGATRYLLPAFALAIVCATPLLSLAGIAGLTVACVLMRNVIACKKYGDLEQSL